MKNKFASVLFSFLIALAPAATQSAPSLDYLSHNTFEKIEDAFKEQLLEEKFRENLPFFYDIISTERDSPVFGYHGCSQEYRIYQDILRAVFEEVLEYDIPEDFQFLRIPGSSEYDIEKGKDSYLSKFARCHHPEIIDELTDKLILKHLESEFGAALNSQNLCFEDQRALREYWIEFAEYFDGFTIQQKGGSLPQSLENCCDSLLNALTATAQNIDPAALIGWMGRHLDFKNIHKLIIDLPGSSDYANSASFPKFIEEVSRYLCPYLDTLPDRKQRVVSLNISLFANYFRSDECSLNIFLEDNSIDGGEERTKCDLEVFFHEIGIPDEIVESLYDIAFEEFGGEPKYGCLLQFRDVSQDRLYGLIDHSAFVCYYAGKPHKEAAPSDVVMGLYPLRQDWIDLQLRLVMCNATTLNPFGSLRIVRYDTYGLKTSEAMVEKMKALLRETPINGIKAAKYRDKMDAFWKKKCIEAF